MNSIIIFLPPSSLYFRETLNSFSIFYLSSIRICSFFFLFFLILPLSFFWILVFAFIQFLFLSFLFLSFLFPSFLFPSFIFILLSCSKFAFFDSIYHVFFHFFPFICTFSPFIFQIHGTSPFDFEFSLQVRKIQCLPIFVVVFLIYFDLFLF